MNLLFVSNFYPPYDIGGYEKHCSEAATALRTRGHQVRVLTSRHGVTRPVHDGPVRRELFLESSLEHYDPTHVFLRRNHEEHHNATTLLSVIADTAPRAICFWGMWNLSRRLPAVAESLRCPLAYWVGDTWPVEPDMHTRYWTSFPTRRVGRLAMRWISHLALSRLSSESYPPELQFRHVACASQFLKQRLAAELPAFREAVVVRAGVDLNMFAGYSAHKGLFDPAAPRIIYVGGLAPHKGVHTAVDAVSRLIGRSPRLRPTLTVVGRGHPVYEARLHRMADNAGGPSSVRFVGKVSREAIPSLLASHDVLVVPSVVEEGFGRVVVEGMAAGLVVVGTATGGSAEILADGVNGLVFPIEDADALADRLLQLMREPELYGRLAHEGKRTSEEFGLEQMVDGVERFLAGVVATSEPGDPA